MRHGLHELDTDVDMEEIHTAILQTAPEKAPGLDGYIGAFFKACWDIVKHDLIAALTEIFELRLGCWNLLNSANIVLIEKKECNALETIGLSVSCTVSLSFWQWY
jgi:predicted NAD-dependent protein-ADP-ribosyltransferase YbiA (DUF1768 family)